MLLLQKRLKTNLDCFSIGRFCTILILLLLSDRGWCIKECKVLKNLCFVAFRYGKTLVPMTSDDQKSLKLQTTKGCLVLGFTSQKNVIVVNNIFSGIIHLVRTQNIPENYYFWLHCAYQGVRMYSRMEQVKFVEDNLLKNWGDMVLLSRPYHLIFLKGSLPQIVLGPFLNTLS